MEAVLKYFSSSRFIISLCIAIAALVVWLLVRQIIHRFADRITSAGSLSGRRQTYLALFLNIVRGLLVLAALMYMGRVGIITIGMAAMMRGKKDAKIKYPEARVMIG